MRVFNVLALLTALTACDSEDPDRTPLGVDSGVARCSCAESDGQAVLTCQERNGATRKYSISVSCDLYRQSPFHPVLDAGGGVFDGCQPSCVGKCAGDSDGCGGVCTTSHGCMMHGTCVPFRSQNLHICGANGAVCMDCVAGSCVNGICL